MTTRASFLGPMLATLFAASSSAAAPHVLPGPDALIGHDEPPQPSVARSFDAVVAALSPFCNHACGSSELRIDRAFAHNAAMVPLPAAHESVVVYDPALFQAIAPASRDTGIAGVLAHEYGHHLDLVGSVQIGAIPGFRFAFVAAATESWRRELRADAWAGCALGRLGKEVAPLVAWMRQEQIDWLAQAAEKSDDDVSHPPWNLRIAATSEGWVRCGGRGPEPAEAIFQRALFATPPPSALRAPRPEEELLRRFGIVAR